MLPKPVLGFGSVLIKPFLSFTQLQKKSFKILKKTNVGDNMLRHKNSLTEPIIACSDHKMWRLIYMFLMFIISHCIYPF